MINNIHDYGLCGSTKYIEGCPCKCHKTLECHITVNTKENEKIKNICNKFAWRYTGKLKENSYICTRSGNDKEILETQMREMLLVLKHNNLHVIRYKIEQILLDSKYD